MTVFLAVSILPREPANKLRREAPDVCLWRSCEFVSSVKLSRLLVGLIQTADLYRTSRFNPTRATRPRLTSSTVTSAFDRSSTTALQHKRILRVCFSRAGFLQELKGKWKIVAIGNSAILALVVSGVNELTPAGSPRALTPCQKTNFNDSMNMMHSRTRWKPGMV